MVNRIIDLKNELEVAIKIYQESLFTFYSNCTGASGESYVVEVSLSTSQLETMESTAYELQDEILQFEKDNRLKQWCELTGTICQEVIDLTSLGGRIHNVAQFDMIKEQEKLNDKPIFDNDHLDSYLETITEKAYENLESLMEDAKEDVFELEAKLQQLLALLNSFIVQVQQTSKV